MSKFLATRPILVAAILLGALHRSHLVAAETVVLAGRCVDSVDQMPLADVRVRLFKFARSLEPPTEVAMARTNARGEYEFADVESLPTCDSFHPLAYWIVGDVDGRPLGLTSFGPPFRQALELPLLRDQVTLRGRVVDDQNRPVVGAVVARFAHQGVTIPDVLSDTTNAEGEFAIERVFTLPPGDLRALTNTLEVRHPDYPAVAVRGGQDDPWLIRLEPGCIVTGAVLDEADNEPIAKAVVTFERIDKAPQQRQQVRSANRVSDPDDGRTAAATDAAGRFRAAIPDGRYNVIVDIADRVVVAVLDQPFNAGESIELPPLRATEGGFLLGRVVDEAGLPTTRTPEGDPIEIGLYGPAVPANPSVTSPMVRTTVDDSGRFILRAAPGENFPYFVNTHGDRMAWDTRQQAAVVVRSGETSIARMTMRPPPDVRDPGGLKRRQAAELVIAALPKEPKDRVDAILAEFDRLNKTVDECELWCGLMRELVAVAPDAVPRLCWELDNAEDNIAIRRLAFALRAIGDKRAVPALIRAIPKTLQPPGSDYGLLVADPALTAFMQQHDLDARVGGQHFSFGRPVREVFGALHKLTGEDFGDAEIFGMSRGDDPRRVALQRRLYQRKAERWAKWWNDHARDFFDDPAHHDAKLPPLDEPPPPPIKLADGARFDETGYSGLTISPPAEPGEHTWHFIDLDTGYRPTWPAHIPRDESQIDFAVLAKWARDVGADLMCVRYTDADGAEVFALRGFDLTAVELSDRERRDLEANLAAGKPPSGRATGELLIHVEPATGESTANANAAFLYTTREGTHGLIDTTDRVVRTADLTGQPAGNVSAGVGFHRGVKFDWKPLAAK